MAMHGSRKDKRLGQDGFAPARRINGPSVDATSHDATLFALAAAFALDASNTSAAQSGPETNSPAAGLPTDSFFNQQWHLRNTGQSGGTAGVDVRIFEGSTSVWSEFSGVGIAVGIIDDGIDLTHPDLNDNYVAARHAVVNGVTINGNHFDAQGAHGTAVAGIIAAERNGTGVVGIAYDAEITSIPAIPSSGGSGTPPIGIVDAVANIRNFDVVNNSWGFTTPFSNNINDPSWNTYFANLGSALSQGRGGLGTIIVKSAGNSRAENYNTSAESTTSFYGSIAVAALDHNGFIASYSTEGAGILVSAPAGVFTDPGRIWTTDRGGGLGYNNPTGQDLYTQGFNGTSAAAPMVTGIVALILDANPNLGWRDVQQILAYSSRHTGSAIGSGPSGSERYSWGFNGADNWNGGGLHFSEDYGYGLVDALAAVRLAEYWNETSTNANLTTFSVARMGPFVIPDNNATGVSITFTTSTNIDIEHITLHLAGSHTYLADLVIELISPDGTVSTLHQGNLGSIDFPSSGWDLTSNEFRGELSAGTWTVRIRDLAAQDTGSISSASLTFRGDAQITNDRYVFTNEFSDYQTPARRTITDTDGGTDTLNASAVSSNSTIQLTPGQISTIDGVQVTIAAGSQIENAIGGDGNDYIVGTSGNNLLIGGRGNDFINGLTGVDTMIGGAGNDTYHYDVVGDVAIEEADGGTDLVRTLVSINAQNPLSDNIENVQLNGVGNFLVVGNSLVNVMNGNSGINQLRGMGGNDYLFGFDGDDVIIGGTGRDTMTGGNGSDTFHFDSLAELGNSASTRDVITDFVAREDHLDFNTMDANSVLAGNQDFTFVGTDAFTGAGQLRFELSAGGPGTADDRTYVYGNLDNNLSTIEFQIELRGLVALSAVDIIG